VQKGEMVMKKKAEILIEYVQADFCKRMYMFLQFPDLRDAFQEIDRNKLRCPTGFSYATEQKSKEECFRNPSLPIGTYCGLAEIRTFKAFLESLTGLKPNKGIP
jgi:hypothetical protein